VIILNDKSSNNEENYDKKLIPPIPTGKIDSEFVGGSLIANSANILTKDSPEGFLNLVTHIITSNVKNLPKFIKKNWIWLVSIIVLWFVLLLIPTYRLPRGISGFFSFLIFITAAYNNFVAKALYLIFVNSTAIPIYNEVKDNGLLSTLNRYKKAFEIIVNSFKRLQLKAIPIFLYGFGLALLISNFLSRNNKPDKYLICLITGFMFFRSLSQGLGSISIKLFKSVSADTLKILKINSTISNSFVYILFSGFSAGFAGAIISSFLYGLLGDYTGYILGAFFIVSAIVLTFVFTNNVKQNS
jgi:hypothetical protein